MKLTLVRGIPGSGKSTFVRNNFSCLHLENDMYFQRDGSYRWNSEEMDDAIRWCVQMSEIALSRGMDVVVSNTFTKKRYMEPYRKMAESIGAEFEVVRCEGNFKNVHNVPEKVLENMKKNFEDYPGERILP